MIGDTWPCASHSDHAENEIVLNLSDGLDPKLDDAPVGRVLDRYSKECALYLRRFWL